MNLKCLTLWKTEIITFDTFRLKLDWKLALPISEVLIEQVFVTFTLWKWINNLSVSLHCSLYINRAFNRIIDYIDISKKSISFPAIRRKFVALKTLLVLCHCNYNLRLYDINDSELNIRSYTFDPATGIYYQDLLFLGVNRFIFFDQFVDTLNVVFKI